MNNYVVYHLHDMYSILDSTTSYKDYINKAKEYGMNAIAFSNHGNIYDWVLKKNECDKVGIKYIHGVEAYLTESLEHKINDNYHIGLYARNIEGVKELNKLITLSTDKDHKYYKPRISIQELQATSKNIIITTACLGSPIWKFIKNKQQEKVNNFLLWCSKNKDRVFLEIQYHQYDEQIKYNKVLFLLAKKYGLKLIAGTDTHNINKEKSESRWILKKAKKILYDDEDKFDLCFKSYDELVEMFRQQNCLPMDVVLEAIDNTNLLSNMCEDFELDKNYKYPNLYQNIEDVILETLRNKIKTKIQMGVIIEDNKKLYFDKIKEELVAFKKQNMLAFMLFMSELTTWCWENNIIIGYGRGSVSGSLIAYILDITDVNPITWNTVFSRFCNEDRISLADIDLDFYQDDRQKVFDYIISRFPKDHTAYITSFSTIAEKGTIDEICRALEISLTDAKIIKSEFEANPEQAKQRYPEVFKYFDSLLGTIIASSTHPAGIVASPISLNDNLGLYYNEDGYLTTQIAMKSVDMMNYVKFDILGLKNIGIIKKTYNYINQKYKKSHEINWNDNDVWSDMIRCRVGVFQFESPHAASCLKQFKPKSIHDMSLVNAALRPSGDSYRDRLLNRLANKNPSIEIDLLLKENLGYLVFQEDTIKFLTNVCGFNGSEADTVRRGIGKKQFELLDKMMPKIIQGYCQKSNKPYDIAKQEVTQFISIIMDAADYQFNYNHSIAYSMIGYTCAMLRYFHPLEFTTAFLNCAENDDDFDMGRELASFKNIKINPIRFRYSKAEYFFDKEKNTIYKGIGSIKHLNDAVGEELYAIRNIEFKNFIDLLVYFKENIKIKSNQLEILIILNYFIEFGENDYLLNITELFKQWYGKKVINKSKVNFQDVTLIKANGKETKEQFRDLDWLCILNALVNKLDKNTKLDIHEQLAKETLYIGQPITKLSDVSNKLAYIIDIYDKYNPKIKLYYLQSGDIKYVKINKKTYLKSNIELYKLIQIDKTSERPKKIKINDKWIDSSQMESWIVSYQIV
jgi:DNA polymerase-3 subunit alpha